MESVAAGRRAGPHGGDSWRQWRATDARECDGVSESVVE